MKSDRTERWLALGRGAPVGVAVGAADVRAGCVAPVVQLILASRPRIFGISGPAGAGKSTVAAAVAESLVTVGMRAVALSLDDFYLPRQDRERRGLKWRAAPGSHDLDLMVRTLAAIEEGAEPLLLPRFDASRDDRTAEERLDQPPDVVVFDGWILGYDDQGYERVLPYLDWHLHLAVPPEVAKERRFGRERAGGAFTEEEMQRFWDEVLGPGMDTWVRASAEHADIVVELTGTGPTCLAEPRLDEFLP